MTLESETRKPATNYVLSALGIALLAFTIPSIMLMLSIWPPGLYPPILLGLPALPALWLGLVCLRRAGLPVEDFVHRRPRLFGVIVGIGSMVLIFATFLLAHSLGLVD